MKTVFSCALLALISANALAQETLEDVLKKNICALVTTEKITVFANRPSAQIGELIMSVKPSEKRRSFLKDSHFNLLDAGATIMITGDRTARDISYVSFLGSKTLAEIEELSGKKLRFQCYRMIR